MQLSYYIHNNPVRADIVKRLIDYRWSSYPAYAYNSHHSNWNPKLERAGLLAKVLSSAVVGIDAYRLIADA